MDGEGTLGDIAVDSCSGYIYWINQKEKYKSITERARFNGVEREVIRTHYDGDKILNLVIDPPTRRIYFTTRYIKGKGNEYLEVVNLLGYKLETMYAFESGNYSLANQLTASKDYIYGVNSLAGENTVSKLPKNARKDKKREKISTFKTGNSLAIATNYKIEDQTMDIQGCEALSSLIPINTVANNSVNMEQTTGIDSTTEYTIEVELFCVHGVHVRETSVCECTPGYIGERCDISACVNYCLQGNCSLNEEGLPNCSCNTGYSGERCEVYACHGYCRNDGDCSLKMEGGPVCQCTGNHEGLRCDTDIRDNTTDTSTYDLVKRNITLNELLSRFRKPSSKMFFTVEV